MDEFRYRAPFHRAVVPTPAKASSQDEANFDTVKHVTKTIETYMNGLDKDFNTFSILRGEPNDTVLNDLMIQIRVKQEIYTMLLPLVEALNTTIMSVDSQIKLNKPE